MIEIVIRIKFEKCLHTHTHIRHWKIGTRKSDAVTIFVIKYVIYEFNVCVCLNFSVHRTNFHLKISFSQAFERTSESERNLSNLKLKRGRWDTTIFNSVFFFLVCLLPPSFLEFGTYILTRKEGIFWIIH